MAFVHGKDVVIYVNASNYSTYFNNADSTQTADIAETTTFGNSNKTYVPGEKDGTISLGGLFDATSDVVALSLNGNGNINGAAQHIPSIANNAGSGVTGDIQLTNSSASVGTIILHCRKVSGYDNIT